MVIFTDGVYCPKNMSTGEVIKWKESFMKIHKIIPHDKKLYPYLERGLRNANTKN